MHGLNFLAGWQFVTVNTLFHQYTLTCTYICTVSRQESPLDPTLRTFSEQGVSPQQQAPPPSHQSLQAPTPPLLQMSQTPLQTYPTLTPMDQTQSPSSLQPVAASPAPQNQIEEPLSQQPTKLVEPHTSADPLTPSSSTSQSQQAATLQVRPHPALRLECLAFSHAQTH